MRTLLCFSIGVIAAVAMFVASSERASAHSSIRVATSPDADAIGLAVRWDLSNANSRTNISNRRVHYVMGSAGTLDHDDMTGPFTEFQAVQRSFKIWRDAPRSEVDFEFKGTVASPVEDNADDINTVFWDDSGISPGIFATTVTTFFEDSGEIVDADLVFNDGSDSSGKFFVWDSIAATATEGDVGITYIENIAVHEIGHFVGLDHTFNTVGSMYPFTDPGAINLITLAQDDLAQINADHPDPDAADPGYARVSGRVTSSGTGRLGVVVSLIDIETGQAVMSAISDRDTSSTDAGDYEIVDVPPGNYWVAASRLFTANIGQYYSSSFTNFLPTLLGVAGGLSGVPDVLRVTPGGVFTGIDVEVSAVSSPFESDNTSGTATDISVGEALGARIESSSDVDFFSFTAAAGEEIVIQVHSDSLGQQELNPLLTLYDTDGSTKLVTGEFGDAAFEQSARDIEPDAFGVAGVNFDARIEYTFTDSGTYYVRVRGTAQGTGDYILTLHSDRSFDSVDSNATSISASVAGAPVSGADFTITVVPKNTAGAAFPDTDDFEVELLDISNGSAVLDTIDGQGPWTFTVSPPGTAQIVEYGVNIDGELMDRTLSLSFTSDFDTGESDINVIATSLVRDGVDTSRVEVRVRDSAGRLVVDDSLSVEIEASAGTLTAGASSGGNVEAAFEAATGFWTATLRAPTSGAAITVSATINGDDIDGETVALTAAVNDAQLAALTILTASLPDAALNTFYSQGLSASGGTLPYVWSDDGNLPGGLTLSSGGLISGTPTAEGGSTFDVTLLDGAGATLTAQLALVVGPEGSQALTILTTSFAALTLDQAYALSLGAQGGTGPYTWAITSGALPEGMELDEDGFIAGAPEESGSFPLTLTVTDSASATASVSLTLTVTSPPKPKPPSKNGCSLNIAPDLRWTMTVALLSLAVLGFAARRRREWRR